MGAEVAALRGAPSRTLPSATPLYRAGLADEDRQLLRPWFLLTDKPVLAVVNVGEDDVDGANARVGARRPANSTVTVEVLGALRPARSGGRRSSRPSGRRCSTGLGLGEGALPRLVRSAYHLLGLRTFLTTGDKESRAWTFRAGAKAPECAGVIHSDLQRGFIRAEVIRWDELLAIGSWTKAKEAGKLRVEGKDYEVVDGDVLEIRFNV